MKICFLADSTSAHTKKWCDYFLSRGYEIIIISLTDGNIPGCKVYNFNVGETIYNNDIKKLFSYFGKIKRVKNIIKEEKPDIVHAHYATSYGLLGSLVNFKPYILSVWGSDVYDFPRRSVIHRGLLKYNLKKPSVIMSTSNDMKDEIQKYTNRDVMVTYFGVNTNVFKPIPNLKSSNVFTVGTIKSLFKIYGLEYLLKAFKELTDKYRNDKFKLIIAGKGEEEENLKNLSKELGIDKLVDFKGFLKKDELVNTYNQMDIAVFPSLQESFGVSAVEAQSCGVPVVCSNVGGLPEATNPGYSSILVEPKNTNELFKALEKLYLNKELRENMGKNGRKYVLERFVIEENFAKIDDVYQSFKRRNRWDIWERLL